jgi:hypothetical protein
VRIGVLLLFVGSVLPLAAHHSFAAEFDDKQPLKLDGTVAKFDFMNPHSWIYLDVKNPDGTMVRWSVETGSTNACFAGVGAWSSAQAPQLFAQKAVQMTKDPMHPEGLTEQSVSNLLKAAPAIGILPPSR